MVLAPFDACETDVPKFLFSRPEVVPHDMNVLCGVIRISGISFAVEDPEIEVGLRAINSHSEDFRRQIVPTYRL